MSTESDGARFKMLENRIIELERQVRFHDDEIEMCFRTPYWKRLWFLLDGWPLHRVSKTGPARRWWRRS